MTMHKTGIYAHALDWDISSKANGFLVLNVLSLVSTSRITINYKIITLRIYMNAGTGIDCFYMRQIFQNKFCIKPWCQDMYPCALVYRKAKCLL